MQDSFLWQELIKDIKPLKKQPFPPRLFKKVKVNINPSESGIRLESFGMKDLVKGDISAMDKANGTRLRKGKIRPQARLDLHGFTAEQAFNALKKFIIREYNKATKCVIIVTGRGRAVMDEFGHLSINNGVLYGEIGKWLNYPDIRGYIVSFTPAADFDGGEGAVYVYLRSLAKDKKKNKAERVFNDGYGEKKEPPIYEKS